MRKIFKYNMCMFLALAVGLSACKDHDLEDFAIQQTDPSAVSAGDVIGEIVKSNERITVPIQVTLSTPATKAFEVGVALNVDTVDQLIADNVLTGTAALPANAVELPNVVKVAYGASTASFEVSISVTAIEKYYGQAIAFAFNLVDPGKGNHIGSEGSGVVVLNTEDLLNESEIHYVSFTNGGGEVIEARNRQNYTVTSAGLTVPLGITLAGVPSRSFTVKTTVNTDTIAQLKAEGVLPDNVIALQPGDYDLDELHTIGSNLSSAPLTVNIPWSVIEANLDNTLALSVALEDPSRHILDYEKNTTVILIHPNLVVEVDVTNEGAYSVSRDNGAGPEGGEGSLKLIDNDYNSKFLQGDFVGDLWMQLIFDEPQLIGAYTFTSGNDAPTRDPKSWNLEASNDGENWVTIDERSEETFGTRLETRRFEIATPVAYTHFRLNITENGGSNLFQMTEWRMIRVP